MASQIPQIVMRSGPIPGSSFFLDKSEVYIGRDLSNDVPVPDPEISRRHARFFVRDEGIFFEDLGSTNGSFLNGVRLTSPQLLHNGDIITLADSTAMRYEYEPAPSEVPPAVPHGNNEMPVEPVYVEAQPEAPAPVATRKAPKKLNCFFTILIVLLIIMIVVGVVLIFMPESWWCALTFNSISGCPVRP